MQIYTNSVFWAFLDVPSLRFFDSFVLPMDCQINDEALGCHCCQITPARELSLGSCVTRQDKHLKRNSSTSWAEDRYGQKSESQKETKTKIVKVPQLQKMEKKKKNQKKRKEKQLLQK